MTNEIERQNLEDLRALVHILIEHATIEQLRAYEEIPYELPMDEPVEPVDPSPDARLNQTIATRQFLQEWLENFRQGKTDWRVPKADESKIIKLAEQIVVRSAN